MDIVRPAFETDAGWSSLVARRAHNPKVVGSNPAPATNDEVTKAKIPVAGWSSLVARRAHNPKVVGSNPAPATKFIVYRTHFNNSHPYARPDILADCPDSILIH